MAWKEINTAPKDGTEILAHNKGWKSPKVMYWRKVSSFWGGDIQEFWAKEDGRRNYRYEGSVAGVLKIQSNPTHWCHLHEAKP